MALALWPGRDAQERSGNTAVQLELGRRGGSLGSPGRGSVEKSMAREQMPEGDSSGSWVLSPGLDVGVPVQPRPAVWETRPHPALPLRQVTS